jgi:hypothetical protein
MTYEKNSSIYNSGGVFFVDNNPLFIGGYCPTVVFKL